MPDMIKSSSTAGTFGNAPQKTAEPPHHLTSYGGAALNFDGVSDYIEPRMQGGPYFEPSTKDKFTFACWIKTSNGGELLEAGGRIYNSLRIAVYSNVMYIKLNSSTIYNSTKVVNDGQWHRIVITFNKDASSNQLNIYIDGQLDSSHTNTSAFGGFQATTSTGYPMIGANSSALADNVYNGAMCDWQWWVEPWSLSDVIYDYENPEKIITRNSSVTEGIDYKDLELWYPMNGQHSRFAIDAEENTSTSSLGDANLLLDCSYKGPGDEILSNPSLTGTYDTAQDYSAGFVIVDGWTVHTAGSGGSPHTVTEGDNNGSQCIEISSATSGGNYVNFRATSALDIAQGRTYKLQFDAQSTTGSDTHLNVGLHTGPNIAYGYVDGMVVSGTSGTSNGGTSALTVTSTMTTYTFYLTAAASDSTSYLVFGRRHGESACKCLIDNISFKEMRGGYHGHTNFYSLTTDVLTDDQQDAGGLEDVLISDGEYIDFTGTDGTLLDLEDNNRLTNGTFRLGLSDGDVGYDNSDGTLDGWTANDSASLSVLTTELVTGDDSTFTSGVGTWAIATGGGTFVSNVGVGTATHGSGEANHHISVKVTTEIGKEYTVKGTFTQVSGNLYLRVGTSASGVENLSSTALFTGGANGTLAYGTHHFTATSTSTYVTIHHSTEAVYTIDNFGVATTDMKIVNGGADSGSASEYMAVDANGYYQIDASFKTISDELMSSYRNTFTNSGGELRTGSELASGTPTHNKFYEIIAQDGVDFTTYGAPDNYPGTVFCMNHADGSSVPTLDSNDKLWEINLDWDPAGDNKIYNMGDELCGDPAFGTNVSASTTGTHWTTSADWSIGSGVATHDGSGTSNLTTSNLGLTAGKTYRIRLTVGDAGTTTARVKLLLGSSSALAHSEAYLGEGSHSFFATAGSDNDTLIIRHVGGEPTIDDVSIKETDMLVIEYVDDSNGAEMDLTDATNNLTEDLVVGASYRVRVNAKVDSGDNVNIREFTGSGSGGNNFVTGTSFAEQNLDFDAAGTATNASIRVLNMDAGEKIYIDDISVKRITTPKVAIWAGTSANSSNYGIVENTSDNPTIRCFASVVSTSLYVTVGIKDSDVATNYCLVDNISVKQVDKFADHIIDVTGDYGGIPTEASFAVSSNKGQLKAVNSKRPVVCIPFQTRNGRAYRVKLTNDGGSSGSPGGAYVGVATHWMTWAGQAPSTSLSVLSGEAKLRTSGEEVFIVANNQRCFAFIYIENGTTNDSRDFTGLYLQEEGYGTAWTLVNRQEIIPQLPFLNGSRKMYWDGTNRVIQNSATGDCPLKGLGAFSVNLWSRKPIGTGAHVLVGHDGGGSYWRYTSATQIITHMDLSTENSTGTATASHGLVDDGKLKMYTMTYDGTTGKMYIDGNFIKSDAGEGTLDKGYENIGNYAGSSYTDGGYSDEVSKWNVALTQAEIIELYNDGVFKDAREHSKKNNLLAYYKNNVFMSTDGTSEYWKDLAPTDNLTFATGSGQTVDYGSDSSLANTFDGGGTISMWIKSTHADLALGYLLYKSEGANEGWWFYTSDTSGTTGHLFLQHFFDGGSNLTMRTSGSRPLSTETIHHVVVTYDNSSASNTPTFYIDGTLQTTATSGGGISAPTGTRISDSGRALKGGYKSSGREWEGFMDNIVIFNREITADEVTTIYNAGRKSHLIEDGHFSNNDMMMYHTFNVERRESDGKPTDQSGNGNHATLNSTVLKGGYHGDVTGLSTDTNKICEEWINESPASTSDLRIDANGMELNKDHNKEHGIYFFGNGDSEGPYMQLNNEISLDKNYTISFWAKDDYTFGGSRILGGSSNSLIKTAGYDHIYFRAGTDGSGFTAAYKLTISNVGIYNDGDPTHFMHPMWHHYTVVNKTGVYLLYINGTLQSNTETATQPFNLQYIGAGNSTAYTAQGTWIDDLLLYDVPLEATDIQKIYNRGKIQHPQETSSDEV